MTSPVQMSNPPPSPSNTELSEVRTSHVYSPSYAGALRSRRDLSPLTPKSESMEQVIILKEARISLLQQQVDSLQHTCQIMRKEIDLLSSETSKFYQKYLVSKEEVSSLKQRIHFLEKSQPHTLET